MLSELLKKNSKLNALILSRHLKKYNILCAKDDLLEIRVLKNELVFHIFRLTTENIDTSEFPHFFKEYFIIIVTTKSNIPLLAVRGGIFAVEPFIDMDIDSLMYSESELLPFAAQSLFTLCNYIYPSNDMIANISEDDFETLQNLYPDASACVLDELCFADSDQGKEGLQQLLEYIITYADVSFFSIRPDENADTHSLFTCFENLGFPFCIEEDNMFYACYGGSSCCLEDFRRIRIYLLLKIGYTRNQLFQMGYWEKEIDSVSDLL